MAHLGLSCQKIKKCMSTLNLVILLKIKTSKLPSAQLWECESQRGGINSLRNRNSPEDRKSLWD